jgi:hypothetical protein
VRGCLEVACGTDACSLRNHSATDGCHARVPRKTTHTQRPLRATAAIRPERSAFGLGPGAATLAAQRQLSVAVSTLHRSSFSTDVLFQCPVVVLYEQAVLVTRRSSIQHEPTAFFRALTTDGRLGRCRSGRRRVSRGNRSKRNSRHQTGCHCHSCARLRMSRW